jgi:hypothetical protein
METYNGGIAGEGDSEHLMGISSNELHPAIKEKLKRQVENL